MEKVKTLFSDPTLLVQVFELYQFDIIQCLDGFDT